MKPARDVYGAVHMVRGQIAGCENLALELEQLLATEARAERARQIRDEMDAVLELQAQYEELLRLAGQANRPPR